MTTAADRDRRRRAAEELPPDSRDVAASDARRWSGIVRCSWCGRETQDDWTPAPEDQIERICARCLSMVRDPGGKD